MPTPSLPLGSLPARSEQEGAPSTSSPWRPRPARRRRSRPSGKKESLFARNGCTLSDCHSRQKPLPSLNFAPLRIQRLSVSFPMLAPAKRSRNKEPRALMSTESNLGASRAPGLKRDDHVDGGGDDDDDNNTLSSLDPKKKKLIHHQPPPPTHNNNKKKKRTAPRSRSSRRSPTTSATRSWRSSPPPPPTSPRTRRS